MSSTLCSPPNGRDSGSMILKVTIPNGHRKEDERPSNATSLKREGFSLRGAIISRHALTQSVPE